MKDFLDNYEIIGYADGACRENGSINSKGGWAFVIRFDNNSKEIHSAGYSGTTTNQRMEMTAVIKILEEIEKRWKDRKVSAIIFSDSKYVVNGSTKWMFDWEKKGWQRTAKKNCRGDLKNLDLWKIMFHLVTKIQPNICWIKGHSGQKYNELCDDLATTAIAACSDYYKAIRI